MAPAFLLLWGLLGRVRCSTDSYTVQTTHSGGTESDFKHWTSHNPSFPTYKRVLPTKSEETAPSVMITALPAGQKTLVNYSGNVKTLLPEMIMPLETSVSEPADNALNTTHATTQQNNGKDTSAAVDVVTSEKGCHGNARRLRERAGKVEWKGDNQPVVCSWLIDVDPQYGIVFQFLALSLQRGDTRDKDDSLTVYRGHQLDNGKQLRRVVGNLPVPPVVERSSQLYISLETHGLYNRTRKGESSFTFSYKTYLSREIPLLTDRGRYNCSAPYIVPEAFRCDMVEQCYAGEDEVNYNCTYHEPRCEKGWIFANWTTWSACLKLFASGVPQIHYHFLFACPDSGVSDGRKYAMAFFPTAESRQLAARLTTLAGYEEVSVEFATYIREGSVRRFVARWADLYNDFKNQLVSRFVCATLHFSPTIHLRPQTHASCESKKVLSHSICMRKYRAHVLSFDHILTLPPPSRSPDKFPVKNCSDGTFVHTFHFCESDIDQATWSESNMPLLHCNNGRRVHYTLHCDGFDDCGDKTDEQYCRNLFNYDDYNAAHFPCRYTHERIGNDLVCNGRQDCHDGSDEGRFCERRKCQPGMVLCAKFGCLPASHATSLLCSTGDGKSQSRSQHYHYDFGSTPEDGQSSLLKLDFDRYGFSKLTELAEGETCPETHFPCQGNLCIPSFLVKDGEYDCPWPYLDDEKIRGYTCPGYYRCYRHNLCLHPDYLCDGVYQCPLKDDERYCNLTCPENCTCEGYAYTCRQTYRVLDFPLARYQDFSGSRQLQNLPRFGYVRFLNLSFCGLKETKLDLLSHLRILDLSHNLLTYDSLKRWRRLQRLTHLNLSSNPLGPRLDNQFTNVAQENFMEDLRSLSLRNTGLRRIGSDSFIELRNLKYLDISENGVDFIPDNTFIVIRQLEHLDVSGNQIKLSNKDLPMSLKFLDISDNGVESIPENTFLGMRYLEYLDLSGNQIKSVAISMPWNLKHLDISDNEIGIIPENIFIAQKQLRYLNLQQNKIHSISKDMFRGPDNLVTLLADDYSLCCSYFSLYSGTSGDRECHAPVDELSSCSDLLRSNVYRVCLWIFSLLAMLGNTGVLVYRLCLEAEGSSSGFRVLVANLCGSDFLMGVYLMMIGSADIHLSGQYVWKREWWTQSAVCRTAGFLALVSSEVSAFIVCIITLDRLLVLRFPLKRHLHLTWRSTMVACGAAWVMGIALAMVPLLPTTGWEFYSQTGICLPLPITRANFPGKQYAFGVFIVLNFVLFLLIVSGQILIYRAVRSTSLDDRTQRRQQDMAIARRLFLIVFSDYCCWFPVCVMGLLASQGTPIAGEFNVLAAIFVMPINSAINPFLYTLNTLLERRSKRRYEARIERMMGRLRAEMNTWPAERLAEVAKHLQQITDRQRSRTLVPFAETLTRTNGNEAGVTCGGFTSERTVGGTTVSKHDDGVRI